MTTPVDTMQYVPVDLATLRLDTVKSFDLYLKVEGGKYVLYLSRESPFTQGDLESLAAKQITRLYVSPEEKDNYTRYLEQHLPAIISDPHIATETKARIVYETSSTVVHDLFDNPTAESIQRSKETVSSTVSLILSNDEAMKTLIQLTSHDYYTYTHSVNVSIYSVALSKTVLATASDAEIHRLGAGFVLHDIGKSRIPREILSKQGALDVQEWELIRSHPEEGARILQKTNHLTQEASVICLQHHERFNGSGYPKGLKATRIHKYAQVCAIADVFDALTTDRSYSKAVSTFDALTTMKTDMKELFSTEFFEQFVKLLSPEQ